MNILLVAFGAYLMGSIPFAVLVSRLLGLADPRGYGSGNPGATNVLRSGSKLAAALTLLGDALKGWLPVWLISRYGVDMGLHSPAVAVAGLGAFIGHVFPFTLGFKGGKGVATALGVLVGYGGWIALSCAGIWIAVVALTRYSSLAALCAALAAPALVHWFGGTEAMTGATIVMSLFLIWRHAENIQRLLAGTESRVGGANKT